MINNPLIDTYFVSNRQVSEFTNDERIELINEFIEYETSLPNSFKIYFINEISEEEFFKNFNNQKEKYLNFYKYSTDNEFALEFLEVFSNTFHNLDLDMWNEVEYDLTIHSTVLFGLNFYYRFKDYEEQFQFLLINKDLKYNFQYLNNMLNYINNQCNKLIYDNKDSIIINDTPKENNLLHFQEPFKNKTTKDLFEYLVENWSNSNTNRWGYLWEYLQTKGNGSLTYKVDYENYIRKIYSITNGKFNYDSCNSNKRFEELDDLKKIFLKKIDLI